MNNKARAFVGLNFKNGLSAIVGLFFNVNEKNNNIIYPKTFKIDGLVFKIVYTNEKNGNVIYEEI